MNHTIHRVLLSCLFLSASLAVPVQAQQCEIPVNIIIDEQLCPIPEAARHSLENHLRRIALKTGITTDLSAASQFVLTAKTDVLDEHVISGPPHQFVANIGISLYIADLTNQKQFATTYIETDGVGNTRQLCYKNAYKAINLESQNVSSFIENGKNAILDYFNTQYPNIIKEARNAEKLQNYEEALLLCFSVPSCSQGYDECTRVGTEIYNHYRDRLNQALLQRAQAVWAAGQDEFAASEACEIISSIDPEAACYGAAGSLMKEIKAQIRKDIDFEMREKYRDQVDLEKKRIEAARAVGVAFGNGQKPRTTNVTWLH